MCASLVVLAAAALLVSRLFRPAVHIDRHATTSAAASVVACLLALHGGGYAADLLHGS